MRPLDEVLGAPGVPDAIRRHERRFRELDLTLVRHVAVDCQHDTANPYFRTRGNPQGRDRLHRADGHTDRRLRDGVRDRAAE